MLDDWTFNYQDRIFAAPYIALQDPDARRARGRVRARERRARRRDARRSGARPGLLASARRPGVRPRCGRALAEAGILAAYHSGDAGYGRYADEWGGGGDFQAFRNDPFRNVTGGHRPIYDTDRRARVPRRVRAATRTCASRRSRAAPTGCRCCCKALKKSYGQIAGRVRRASTRSSRCATTCGCRRTTRTTSPELRDELGADADDLRLRLPARRGPRRPEVVRRRPARRSPTTRSGS